MEYVGVYSASLNATADDAASFTVECNSSFRMFTQFCLKAGRERDPQTWLQAIKKHQQTRALLFLLVLFFSFKQLLLMIMQCLLQLQQMTSKLTLLINYVSPCSVTVQLCIFLPKCESNTRDRVLFCAFSSWK